MTVTGIEISRHAGDLKAHAGNSNRSWSDRGGLELRITTAAGDMGQGEASPLPDYSYETIDDAQAALQACSMPWLTDVLALTQIKSILAAIGEHSVAAVPSARFAVETAILDLVGKRIQKPLPYLFTETPHKSLANAQLLPSESVENCLTVAEQAWGAGVRTFKLKIGAQQQWDQELLILRLLRERFDSSLSLRLDANQSLAGPGLLTQLMQIAEFNPEYVEEPCTLPSLLKLQTLPMTIAFDETLSEPEHASRLMSWVKEHPGTVLVMKPMKLGGFAQCLHWANLAQQHDAKLVLSHLYDGPIALAACAALAVILPGVQLAPGLAPHAGLSAWPPTSLPMITPAQVLCSATPGLGLPPPLALSP